MTATKKQKILRGFLGGSMLYLANFGYHMSEAINLGNYVEMGRTKLKSCEQDYKFFSEFLQMENFPRRAAQLESTDDEPAEISIDIFFDGERLREHARNIVNEYSSIKKATEELDKERLREIKRALIPLI